MSEVPGDLKYTESHEWVQLQDDGTVLVGITDHAQEALGELVYVELPEAGAQVSRGDAVAVVESVKAASDLYSPVGGEIVGVNEKLADAPDLVNQQPYGDGWVMRVRPEKAADLEDLLDAEAYEQSLAED